MIRFAEVDNVLCPLCTLTGSSDPLSGFELDLIVKGFSLCPWHDGEIESELIDLGVMSEDTLGSSLIFDEPDEAEEFTQNDTSEPGRFPPLRLLVS